MTKGIITLITDFGTEDHYAGALKGVILSINPEVAIVDVSHEVPAGNIQSGSYMLSQIHPLFPDGTIHLVVVDPGVGGARRPLVLKSSRGFFVGPDNGVFTPVLKSGEVDSVVEITERKYLTGNISATFHGRDVFAPVAAHLSLGTVTIDDLGHTVEDPFFLESCEPEILESTIRGSIINCDRFGNLITNIAEGVLEEFLEGNDLVVETGDKSIEGLKKTYTSVGEGGLLVLIGSGGLLEISKNGGSAKESLGVGEGDEVRIRRAEK
jgi:S-adenosylmethionine hydrolase